MRRAADGRATAGRSRCSRRTRTRARRACRLRDYEDFYYAACLATDADPVTAWERQSDEVKRLAEWIEGKEEVHITGARHRHQARRRGPHTGSPATASTTCPTASSSPARSRTRSRARSPSRSRPATAAARSRACASASRTARSSTPRPSRARTFLIEMLDTDEGARRLGELGIGTNYGIATGTKEILLDEKIGGTVHMAIGMSYPETGGVERLGRALGHGLRPAPGRRARGRRRRAAARRPVPGLGAICFASRLRASRRWSARLSRLSPSSASAGETAQANVTPTSSMPSGMAAASICSASASTSRSAPVSSAPGAITANSSPPMRARQSPLRAARWAA